MPEHSEEIGQVLAAHGLVEVEVVSYYEGPTYGAEPVPYVTPVNWRDGDWERRPKDVRLFAVVPAEQGRGVEP